MIFEYLLPPWWLRPAIQETWVQSLGQDDPLENRMATHSSILAWRIPWTEEPGKLQSTGSQSWTLLNDTHLFHSPLGISFPTSNTGCLLSLPATRSSMKTLCRYLLWVSEVPGSVLDRNCLVNQNRPVTARGELRFLVWETVMKRM